MWSTASHAKLAGLGLAAAVTALTVAAPGVALASGAPEEDAPNATTPTEQRAPSVEEERATTSGQVVVAAPQASPASGAVLVPDVDGPAASGGRGQAADSTGSAADFDRQDGASDHDAGGARAVDAAPGADAETPVTEGSFGVPAAEADGAGGQDGSGAVAQRSAPATVEQVQPTLTAPEQPIAQPHSVGDASETDALPATEDVADGATEPQQHEAQLAVTAATVASDSLSASVDDGSGHAINVFRLYNPWSGEHLYTSSEAEALSLFGIGWRWEGVSYEADAQTGTAVYRLYNPWSGEHLYTTDKGESDRIVPLGWRYEGVAWHSVGSNPLYRLYNPYSGEHLYTADASERDSISGIGWSYEGLAWSIMNGYVPLANMASHMVYSSSYGSYERYWIASDGQLARNRLVHAAENQLGYDVYATSTGAIARNRHVAVSQVVYDAGADGRLSIATNLRGIDIASYQAGMNTANVDADFVIVKATQGTGYTNPYMRTQADNAYNSGKLLGFYHYASTSFGGGNPVAEADYFVQQVGSYAGKALLVLDWEGIDNSRFGVNDAQYCKAFLDRVYQRTGVRGIVYMSRNAANSVDYSSVASSGYGLWVAQYLYYDGRNEYPNYVSTPMTTHSSTTWRSGMTGAWTSPVMYQYTSKGRVSGYSGDLDLDVFYQDSGAWTRMASRA